MTFRQRVDRELAALAELLERKNIQYGNSALEPVRIFSTADAVEQLRVRIDDKLSRLQRGLTDAQEDTELDLLGYLVLLRIAEGDAPVRDAIDPVEVPRRKR